MKRVKISKRKIRHFADKVFGKTSNTAIGIQQQEIEDARLGVVYFLGNLEVEKAASFNTDLFGTFVSGVTPVSDIKDGCQYLLNFTQAGRKLKGGIGAKAELFKESKVGKAVSSGIGKASEQIDKFKQMIAEFFQKMLDKIRLTYGDALHGLEWITEMGTWLVSEFAGSLADAVPGLGYVNNFVDLYDGLRGGILKSKEFIEQLWSGHGVELLGGHPSVIAKALSRHSGIGAAKAVGGLAITTTTIGLKAAGDATSGTGTIIGLVAGILTRIASMIDYIIQRSRLGKVLKKAKEAWLSRTSPGSLVQDHKQFSEWFQTSVITTPIIASLAVGSGFVAHPYRFAKLLVAEDQAISDSEFTKCMKHIKVLQKVAANHISEYKDSYGVEFKSDQPVITGRLAQLDAGASRGFIEHEEIHTTMSYDEHKQLIADNPTATHDAADQFIHEQENLQDIYVQSVQYLYTV
ncbi:hypothetical protein SOPP22_15255 [Shewanella sp. OPT22]|nr:hypothetical protein SOPP22_15255 [Shewanella sp. OPT22]